MDVTDVRMDRTRRGRMVAICSITLDGQLAIHRIRIIERDNDLLVAMPQDATVTPCEECRAPCPANHNHCGRCGAPLALQSQRLGDKKLWHDVVHPISPELRRKIDDAVLDEYVRLGGGDGQ